MHPLLRSSLVVFALLLSLASSDMAFSFVIVRRSVMTCQKRFASTSTCAGAGRRSANIGVATSNIRSIASHITGVISSTSLFQSTPSTDNIPSSSQPTQQSRSLSKKAEHEWTNYEKLVRKLYMTNLFNPVKLGLENMDQLHKALGSPMDKSDISIIHIAGSNGKGSVALKTANALQLAGYKVGLFVSPHISSFRERIQINGQPISESQVEKYLQEIFDICEGEEIPATFFEVTTALAFHIFGQEKVDVVVLETGLGGRLDATNVISKPALSIITSIGLEHTRILGDTIELIAGEKAGIIKKDCPVLIGKNAPFDVLERCAREKGASEVYQSDDLLGPDPKEGEEVGDYDAENSRIASAGLILLQFHMAQQSIDAGKQPKIMTPAEIEEGVKIRPPCRFEEMDIPTPVETDDGITTQKTVRVILDVAHNPQAMDYLLAKLRSNYPHSKDQRIVVGMSADKDLKYCTDILLEHLSNPNKLHLVEASHPRAASISSILEANPKLKESCYSQPQKDELNEAGRDASSVATQVKQALKLAAINNELLVICGSVFIMADAREELGIVEPRDSAVISEVAGAGLRSSQENFGDKK
eukprot:g12827.t1 g12827   contig7:247939-249810(+)